MSQGQALDLLPSHQHLSDRHLTVRDMIVAMAADARMDHENPAALHPLLRHQLCTLILRLQLSSNGSRPEGKKPTAARQRYERFKALLESRYPSWHQVDCYAKALGCTPKSLNRATHALAGLSAKEAIDRRIVLEAKRLLTHTDLPVYQISEGLGFDEATNFSKFFLRHTKQAPAAFRAKHRS